MHVSQLPHEPNPDGTCRVCRSPVSPETMLCIRCGAAYGEKNRCPHCRTISRVLPHPELIHRCSVCGKPRLPPAPTQSPLSPTVRTALQRAGGAHKNALILRVMALVFAGVGVFVGFSMLLFLWVASFGLVGNAVFSVLALVPWLIALICHTSAKSTLRSRDEALRLAYAEQVVALLSETGLSANSTHIASLIGQSVERTDALLAKLNADDRMTSDVTDDGEVVYRVAPPERFRILEEPVPRVDAFAARASPARPSASPDELIEAELDDAQPTGSKHQHRS